MNIAATGHSGSKQPDNLTHKDAVPLIAGYRADGEAIVENVPVSVLPVKTGEDPTYQLLRSPGFVRGLASGDKIFYPANTAAGYKLLKRSGNLSIRVLSKDNIDEIAYTLTPEIELMDGILDMQAERLLVYSIHVSIGFQTIELILDRIIGQYSGTVWYYGNVYDPADGVTPLDWWQEFLAPV
jgi:hypothetical protein